MGLKSLGLKCHHSRRLKDITIQDSWLKSPGLKSLGLKGPGLKLGVEKSEVEMSFNRKIVAAQNGQILVNFGFKLYSCDNFYSNSNVGSGSRRAKASLT